MSIFWLLKCSLLSLGFTTVDLHTLSINVKRIFARAESLSIPLSFSIWTIICSIISFSFWSSFKRSIISVSPSIILLAANLIGTKLLCAWSSIRCIIEWMHLWTAPWSSPSASQKSIRPGLSLWTATCIACSINSSTPSFFAAEIGITGIPSVASSLLTSIVPPLAVTSSIILRARTIGISSSINCIVRYIFRSILVASTILIIPRGRSFKKYSLDTISSLV